LPAALQNFLSEKYGIVLVSRTPAQAYEALLLGTALTLDDPLMTDSYSFSSTPHGMLCI
jgi:hypothetical protein